MAIELTPNSAKATASMRLSDTINSQEFYSCFGYVIGSNFPLPELVPSKSTAPEVLIELTTTPGNEREHDIRFEIDDENSTTTLSFPRIADFVLRGGSKIEIYPSRGASIALVRIPLLGSVLATMLHANGQLVLHASAVELAGRAFIFLGHSGSGKSTTAASLISKGARLISDDVVCLSLVQRGFMVAPGPRSMKLSPDASSTFEVRASIDKSNLHPELDKWRHYLGDNTEHKPVPVGAIYWLRRSSDFLTLPLNPSERTRLLLHYSFLSRFGSLAIAGLSPHIYLHLIAKASRELRVEALSVPDNISNLQGLADHLQHTV